MNKIVFSIDNSSKRLMNVYFAMHVENFVNDKLRAYGELSIADVIKDFGLNPKDVGIEMPYALLYGWKYKDPKYSCIIFEFNRSSRGHKRVKVTIDTSDIEYLY